MKMAEKHPRCHTHARMAAADYAIPEGFYDDLDYDGPGALVTKRRKDESDRGFQRSFDRRAEFPQYTYDLFRQLGAHMKSSEGFEFRHMDDYNPYTGMPVFQKALADAGERSFLMCFLRPKGKPKRNMDALPLMPSLNEVLTFEQNLEHPQLQSLDKGARYFTGTITYVSQPPRAATGIAVVQVLSLGRGAPTYGM